MNRRRICLGHLDLHFVAEQLGEDVTCEVLRYPMVDIHRHDLPGCGLHIVVLHVGGEVGIRSGGYGL